jgi:Cys-rich protein (TIGR01571 family)
MNMPRLEWSTTLFDLSTTPILLGISLIPFACCVIQGISVQRATLKPFLIHCLIGFLPILGSGLNRYIIRERYSISGDFTTDALESLFFCFPVTQEYREVEFRESRMQEIYRKPRSD